MAEKETGRYGVPAQFGPQKPYVPHEIKVIRISEKKVENLLLDFLEINSELGAPIDIRMSIEAIDEYYTSRFIKIGQITSECGRLEKEVEKDSEIWNKIQRLRKDCKELLKTANKALASKEMRRLLRYKKIEGHIQYELEDMRKTADQIKEKIKKRKRKTRREIEKDNIEVHELIKKTEDLLPVAEKIKNSILQESAKNAIYTLENRELRPLIEELKDEYDNYEVNSR